MRNLIFVVLVLSIGCNENVNKNPQKIILHHSDSSTIDRNKTLFIDTSKQEKKFNENKPTYILVLKKDSLKQKMIVQYEDSEQINFTLITSNILKNEVDAISGIATMDDEQQSDPETDETDDGRGFMYDNWQYIKGKCQLSMRIADSAQFIRIFEFNCKGLHKKSCPFETNGVLERVDER